MLDPDRLKLFAALLDDFAADCNQWAKGNGFWDFSHVSDETLAECYQMCVKHANISRGLEALRKGINEDDMADSEWPETLPREKMELVCKVCLIHSEVSELLQAVVFENKDDHLPEYDGTAAEEADTLIRLFDLAAQMKLPLGRATVAKQTYNESRPFRNGKAF